MVLAGCGGDGSVAVSNESPSKLLVRTNQKAPGIGRQETTALQNGSMNLDNATFEEIVNAYYEPLYRFAYSLTHEEADACDFTQETFAQLSRKAGQVEDKSKVKSWLFTTLYRSFIDSHRRRVRHPQVPGEGVLDEMPARAVDAGDQIDAASLMDALKMVPEVFRVPLTLFYLEQHSYLEIAEILDVPVGTVMSRISRGRAALRELMEDPPANVVPLEALKRSVVL
jgi:RNA polymerase sigma factor (sigma-70 family)